MIASDVSVDRQRVVLARADVEHVALLIDRRRSPDRRAGGTPQLRAGAIALLACVAGAIVRPVQIFLPVFRSSATTAPCALQHS